MNEIWSCPHCLNRLGTSICLEGHDTGENPCSKFGWKHLRSKPNPPHTHVWVNLYCKDLFTGWDRKSLSHWLESAHCTKIFSERLQSKIYPTMVTLLATSMRDNSFYHQIDAIVPVEAARKFSQTPTKKPVLKMAWKSEAFSKRWLFCWKPFCLPKGALRQSWLLIFCHSHQISRSPRSRQYRQTGSQLVSRRKRMNFTGNV